MGKIGELYVELQARTAKLDKGLKQAQTSIKNVEKTTNKLSNDLNRNLTPASNKLGSTMVGVGKKIAIAFGAGIGVAGVLMVAKRAITSIAQEGIKFEREWANVTTMLDTSASETQRLRKELINLSPTLGDTTELAKGMYQVLSASIEPAKAIEFLGEAAKSAKAGLTETATAVDALTTVINAYGMRAEDVTKVSDIMFQTVKRGKLTYEQLAQSLGTVVPVASQVGVDFKEVAAATATLTRQGIDAQTATMQLRQVFMAILKPSEQATKLAKQLGLEFSATALRSKGLVKFLAEVKEKTGGSAEKLAVLVPNVRALTGVMGLAGAQSQEFADDLGRMEKSSGQTEIAFRKQMESTGFWIDTLKNAIGKFKISFFDGFISPIKESVGTSKELEAKLEILSYKFQKLGEDAGKAASKVVTAFEYIAASARGPGSWGVAFAETVFDVKKKLTELEEQGYITAKNFQKSLMVLNVPLEKIKEELEKGEKSWIKWAKGVIQADLAAAKAKGGYIGLTGAIAENAEKLRDQAAYILATSKNSKDAYDKLKALKEALKNAASGNKGFNDELENTVSIIEKLKPKFNHLQQGILDATDAFGSGKTSIIEYQTKLRELYGDADRIKNPFKNLEMAVEDVEIQFEESGDVIGDVLKELKINTTGLSDEMLEELSKTAKGIEIRFKTALEHVLDFTRDLASGFADIFVDLLGITESITYQMKDFDDNYWKDALSNAQAAYEEKKQWILDNVSNEEEKNARLLALEKEFEAEKTRIMADEDTARDKHAEREEKRQNSLWNKVKTVFGNAVESMLQAWMTDFIQKMLLSISSQLIPAVTSATTAIGGIGTAVSGIGAGLAGLITGLATAIATAATTLAAAAPAIMVVAAMALAIYAGFKILGSIFGKKGSANQGVERILNLIWEEARNCLNNLDNIKWIMEDVKQTLWRMADNQIPILDDIKHGVWGLSGILESIAENTRDTVNAIGGIPGAASGFHGTVSQPQMIMVHPKEDIDITPFNKPGQSATQPTVTQKNIFEIHAVDAQSFEEFLKRGGGATVAKFVQKELDLKNIRVPMSGVGR